MAKKAPSQAAGKKPAARKSAKPALRPQIARFVDEYLIDFNGKQAAIRAGYSPRTAEMQASRLLSGVKVQEAIAQRQQNRLDRVEIKQDDILRELLNMLAADANELVEHRRHCCRFCWGKGFKYQRTANEFESDKQAHELKMLEQRMDPESAGKPVQPFNEAGGIGYDERQDPNPECPECFGDGVGKTIIKDTRNLTPAARSLYAGVKQTRDGLEVKMQDKQGYITLLMRHAGMLNDKIKLQGDPEAPVEVRTKVVIVPPKVAAIVETKPLKKAEN